MENEDIVGAAPTGDAPTTSEWSTILLPNKVRLILETWRYWGHDKMGPKGPINSKPTLHDNDVIMSVKASRITSLTIVYSSIYSGKDQRKHQSPASLALVRGIHRWLVNSPHIWPVTPKMFPFDDVIMDSENGLVIKSQQSIIWTTWFTDAYTVKSLI